MVERWRVEGNECEVGEKAATVGGLVVPESFLSEPGWPPFAEADEDSDMEFIQGVSVGRQSLFCPGRCSPEPALRRHGLGPRLGHAGNKTQNKLVTHLRLPCTVVVFASH